MRRSQRPAILDAALRVLANESGATITLETVAHEAGISKAGLMYHFPTKEQLMLGIVDHAAEALETSMLVILGKPLADTSAAERIFAYAAVAANGAERRAEYAVWAEAAYRPDLCEPWIERMAPWFELPAGLGLEARVQLTTARLAADGLWAAAATKLFPPDPSIRDSVVAYIQSLTQVSRALGPVTAARASA
ncbi:MAG: TetR/AcrR family transcriptional regulator [Microlunatus sp.]|nr:TetR/AcrR family transcriptional regulator [Microlunatus sp.]MDN5771933.1 TetR/AcrR family transcriptional regulator [Microlunatus sp.]